MEIHLLTLTGMLVCLGAAIFFGKGPATANSADFLGTPLGSAGVPARTDRPQARSITFRLDIANMIPCRSAKKYGRTPRRPPMAESLAFKICVW